MSATSFSFFWFGSYLSARSFFFLLSLHSEQRAYKHPAQNNSSARTAAHDEEEKCTPTSVFNYSLHCDW
jgi:hypothetical protein